MRRLALAGCLGKLTGSITGEALLDTRRRVIRRVLSGREGGSYRDTPPVPVPGGSQGVVRLSGRPGPSQESAWGPALTQIEGR